MDEQRILKLIKAASELEAFEAEMTGRDAEWTAPPVRARRFPRWLAVGLPIAAALTFFFLLPPSLTITEFGAVPTVQRGVDGEARLEIPIEISRPAYVRIVLIDERFERWIIPFEGTPDGTTKHIRDREMLLVSMYPNPNDPRGRSTAIYAMAIASLSQSPTTDDLLAVIPDPVAAADQPRSALEMPLTRIADKLRREFDCVVEFRPIR